MNSAASFTRQDRRWRVRQVLRDFNVRLHTEATSQAARAAGGFGEKLYAVWAEGKQVSLPGPHAKAKADAERLMTDAIMAIFTGDGR